MPKDTTTTYPILLTRTPFGVTPYGVDEQGAFSLQSEALLRAGYIFVRQDVRGRLMSEGTFTHVTPHRPEKQTPTDVDEQSDTWDTLEWLLRHVPNHNAELERDATELSPDARDGPQADALPRLRFGQDAQLRRHRLPSLSS